MKEWQPKLIGLLLVVIGAMVTLLWKGQESADVDTRGDLEKVATQVNSLWATTSTLSEALAALHAEFGVHGHAEQTALGAGRDSRQDEAIERLTTEQARIRQLLTDYLLPLTRNLESRRDD